MKSFDGFPNILIHPGVYQSGNSQSSVTFTIENYEWDVMLLLTRLRWKWTGWAVMSEIFRKRTRKMQIRPYLKGMESLAPTDTEDQAVAKLRANFNATAGAKDIGKATPKDKPFLQCGGDNVNQPWKQGDKNVTGTGEGSDTIVEFTPAMWTTNDTTAAFGPSSGAGPGVTKHEILLHEMVHGMRHMSGSSQCGATPDNPGLDTVEEFMAIVISNVYRSELGHLDLRADHRGFLAMDSRLNDSQAFLDHNKNLPTSNLSRLKQLKAEHPDLCRDLARVTAAFNPFKLL